MRKLEHIGIAVNGLEEANRLFASLLGTEHYKVEEVESEKVRTSFFKVGDVKIELLEATDPESPIAKFISKKGPGVHHLAFDVQDIESSLAELRTKGFNVLNDTPKVGADNKLVAFVHPKSASGVLVELCQEREETKL